jgi:hypothetical protein
MEKLLTTMKIPRAQLIFRSLCEGKMRRKKRRSESLVRVMESM